MLRLFAVAVMVTAFTVMDERVELVRPPRIITDRMSLSLLVRVRPMKDHRTLAVAAVDGMDIVRLSSMNLEGDKARRVFDIHWQPLPAGELELMAIVLNGELDIVGEDSHSLLVLESE